MEFKGNDFSRRFDEFVAGLLVRKLVDLFDAHFDGVAVVAVSFDSVVEGVDMWFNDDESKDMAKFRMKLKVKHGDEMTVFANFDKDVQKLAVETCPVLLSMNESCSLYPVEMKSFCGGSYLCKVKERDDVDFDDLPSFQVTSLCNESGVVAMFLDEYLSRIDDDIACNKDSSLNYMNDGKVAESSLFEGKVDSINAGVGIVSRKIVDEEVSSSNKFVYEKLNFSPLMFDAPFDFERRKNRNGRSMVVEKFMCARRKICAKRMLEFNDDVVDAVYKNKNAKMSECDDKYDSVLFVVGCVSCSWDAVFEYRWTLLCY
ncbi:hypothetical protein L195_g014170 [Trifolium pratense]|uniref:Uncharacterized protein n=1 Tax=Trifolium pratense TaxID=57577 RepID=A0A2K3PQ74_TRIPR|nr:hypothetical protein L195_g014170 [Trifolium pratense]